MLDDHPTRTEAHHSGSMATKPPLRSLTGRCSNCFLVPLSTDEITRGTGELVPLSAPQGLEKHLFKGTLILEGMDSAIGLSGFLILNLHRNPLREVMPDVQSCEEGNQDAYMLHYMY